MTQTTEVPISQIAANPFQTRLTEDEQHIQALAEDIQAHGLLQPPVARFVHVDGQPDVYQLAFGHSRFKAWQIARPGLPFPLEVRESLTDQQMSEYAIAENAHRRDLSAIEKATALRKHIDAFHVTQAEAGRLFDLSPVAVSNLLRLLQLPDPVQDLVQEHQLPERLARQLVPLSASNPDKVTDIAKKVAKAEEGERDDKLDHELGQTLDKIARRFPWSQEDMWQLTWKPEPADVETLLAAKPAMLGGVPTPGGTLPPCKGCEQFLERDRHHYCLLPACYNAKRDVLAIHDAKRVGAKLGIAVAKPGEKVETILDGSYRQEEFARKAMKTKHYSLRILPYAPSESSYDYTRKSVLGSSFVALGTIALAELKAAVAKLPKDKAARDDAKERSERRAESAKERKEMQEATRLIEAAAPLLCGWLPTQQAFQELIVDACGVTTAMAIKTEEKKGADLRVAIMQTLLTQHFETDDEWSWSSSDRTAAQIRKELIKLAEELRVKLPLGWDAEPSTDPPEKKAASKTAKSGKNAKGKKAK